MSYLDFLENHKTEIVNRFEHSRVLENVLTKDMIEQLMLYQFQNSDRVRWTDTSNNIQPILNVTRLFEDIDWMQPFFEKELGLFSEHHTGNYYITTNLHDIHVDLMTEYETKFDWAQNLLPYKSCVIPLAISADAEAYTAFFSQRHIGYSTTFDRYGQSSQDKSMYKITRNYPEFVELKSNNNDKFDNYVFPHIVDENINDLTLEGVYKFTPGNILVFDACQLHASCVTRQRPNFTSLKMGINIQFYIPI